MVTLEDQLSSFLSYTPVQERIGLLRESQQERNYIHKKVLQSFLKM